MRGTALLRLGIPIDRQRDQAFQKIASAERDGVPAHRVGIRHSLGQRCGGDLRHLHGLIGALHHRGPNAVKPAAQIVATRRGEGRAAQLLRVQAIGALLGRVLALRQGARQRLAGDMISKTGVIMTLSIALAHDDSSPCGLAAPDDLGHPRHDMPPSPLNSYI